MTKENLIGKKPRPTSFDVAKAANVSRSSVSLVFTNADGNHVSASTRERILKAAHDLGYEPDRIASTLRKGYSNEIVVLAPEGPTGSVTADWLNFMQERALELEYTLGIYFINNYSESARKKLFAKIVARHPVAISCSFNSITQADWELAKSMGVKACVIEGLEPSTFATTLLLPLKEAVYIAGKHLIEQGHTHIARVCPRKPSRYEKLADSLILDGLHAAIDEVNGSITEFPMNLDVLDASSVINSILSLPNHPTAVIGNRDEYCFFLLKALSASGVHVPQEIALVGINNSPFCEFSNPTLTSVGFDSRLGAFQTVDIIDTIVNERIPRPELLISPQPKLFIRDSS
jgi:LacI family transcriptional regulator